MKVRAANARFPMRICDCILQLPIAALQREDQRSTRLDYYIYPFEKSYSIEKNNKEAAPSKYANVDLHVAKIEFESRKILYIKRI